MPAYLCRWPNGDVTLLNARDKTDAIILLDEFDDAESAELHRLDSLMVDLRLRDDGQFKLCALGETTQAEIMEIAFPELTATLESDELMRLDYESEEYRAMVRRAVNNEQKRMLRKSRGRVREPSTELGKRLQQQTGASTTLVDHWVDSFGREVLEATDDETVQ